MAASRVLFVDDDPSIVRVAELNFRLAGLTVEAAGRGEEAVERAEAARPDAVVLDVTLPDGNGLEVGTRIRALEGLETVPVVFLTGRSAVELPPGLEDAVVVSKPFDPAELVALVQARIDGAAGEQA